MSALLLIPCLILLMAQFCVPRRLVFAPLIIATFLLPDPPIVLGFTTCRLLIAAALCRAVAKGQFSWTKSNGLDLLFVCWSSAAILSAFFHHPQGENPFTIRMSYVYELFGTYLVGRAYVRSPEDVMALSRCLAAVLVPFALLMIFESLTGHNPYSVFGETAQEFSRAGRVRAAGPFGGSFLAGSAAGTASALVLPLFWTRARGLAIAGIIACLFIVRCSASSGPVVSLLASFSGVALWRYRASIGKIRTTVIFVLIGLHLVMKAPVWYLMARIDFVGGSSSWGRAELITQALSHLNEWWFSGTDYTRHWMPYGIEWNAAHTDITNYYIKMGVIGGLPLMLLFIFLFFKAFQFLGKTMQALRTVENGSNEEFVLWCVGSVLFAHAVTFFSVSYFDQSYVPLFLLVGAVSGICRTYTGGQEIPRGGATLDGQHLEDRPIAATFSLAVGGKFLELQVK